jgi:hypothetical protein
MRQTEEKVPTALQVTTAALKDIIGAADGGEPYSPEELVQFFLKDYNTGYTELRKQGLSEY